MDEEPPDALLATYVVYGAKFGFQSGGPGYSGDLYIILGDALTAPMMFIRVEGRLRIAQDLYGLFGIAGISIPVVS